MDFKGENNGEILVVFATSCNCFPICDLHNIMTAIIFLSILTFQIYFI